MSARHNAKILWWSDVPTIDLLKKSLDQGLVSITSTDTVLGFLACLNEKSHKIIDTIKGSKPDKPYLILIDSPLKLPAFVDVQTLSEQAKCIIAKCWPGPLTIIFKAKNNLPACMQSKHGTIALRCPRHSGLLSILAHFDGLFSTSANKSGLPVAKTYQELDHDLLHDVDYVVLDRDLAQNDVPSTIIDVTSSEVRVIRSGAYPVEKLERLCGREAKH